MLIQKTHIAHLKHSFALISRSAAAPHPSGQRKKKIKHTWEGVKTSEHLLDVATDVRAAKLYNLLINGINVKTVSLVLLKSLYIPCAIFIGLTEGNPSISSMLFVFSAYCSRSSTGTLVATLLNKPKAHHCFWSWYCCCFRESWINYTGKTR